VRSEESLERQGEAQSAGGPPERTGEEGARAQWTVPALEDAVRERGGSVDETCARRPGERLPRLFSRGLAAAQQLPGQGPVFLLEAIERRQDLVVDELLGRSRNQAREVGVALSTPKPKAFAPPRSRAEAAAASTILAAAVAAELMRATDRRRPPCASGPGDVAVDTPFEEARKKGGS
jgi:hypothetical protein